MAIRILHVVEAFGVGGGVENGIANLIARLDAKRFEHVLCGVVRVGPQTERYPEHVRILSLDQKPARFRSQVAPLLRVIREVRPQLVHSRNWGAMEGVFSARLAGGCAAVHSEHGVEAQFAAEPGRRKWLRRTAFEMAHRAFAVSHVLRDTLAQSTGFPKHKFAVIHNGVDTSRFGPDAEKRRSFREELGIDGSEFCIGAVGRLSPIKDYPTLLRGVELFSAVCPSWRLLIAGDGSERGTLESLCAGSAALRGRVRFLGPSGRIVELLNAIDAYVLPSLCEGISNSLLEAMATGAPAIATDTGGNPEVVVDGESGLLFPVADSRVLSDRLEFLWRSEGERARLGRAGARRVADEFSLGGMVRQYEQMYVELASSGAPAREANAALAGGKAE
jgi:sugar transferase (PEP-CTERM/EpsH1 system associated)